MVGMNDIVNPQFPFSLHVNTWGTHEHSDMVLALAIFGLKHAVDYFD